MKLHNTLTRIKEELHPLEGNTVKLYTCGLTVYSQPHIGNWVSYVYWDVLQRVLTADGYNVQRIQNITDVGHLVSDDDDGEDKMEKGARAEGTTAWEIADKYISIADHEAYDMLKLIKPTLVRATECIDKQISFVKTLEDKGFTYVIEGEGVYFDTSKLDDYGKLALLDIDGLEAGARVAVSGKKNITDFAVWKLSPKNQKRDMEWDSPWGKGFPGWHLECSVIAHENLGDQIDIHTGGVDHIPVHHTNEIAQSEAATGKPFSTFWVHNNHIKVDGGKMAKSKGNVYTLNDVLERGFSIDAFKLMLLSKHYRTEGNFTWDILEAAQNRLNGYKHMTAHLWQTVPGKSSLDNTYFKDKAQALTDALTDDLNTPVALLILSEVESDIEQQGITQEQSADFENFLEHVDSVLGINLSVDDITDEQRALIQKRAEARKNKDWETSDVLRGTLSDEGIVVEDLPRGQFWSKI